MIRRKTDEPREKNYKQLYYNWVLYEQYNSNKPPLFTLTFVPLCM